MSSPVWGGSVVMAAATVVLPSPPEGSIGVTLSTFRSPRRLTPERSLEGKTLEMKRRNRPQRVASWDFDSRLISSLQSRSRTRPRPLAEDRFYHFHQQKRLHNPRGSTFVKLSYCDSKNEMTSDSFHTGKISASSSSRSRVKELSKSPRIPPSPHQ